ncbi:unnamed protein product [Oppiella nova]|uniref:Uncharacterized protein n=1 Tax=Oppiella nova TaxID=334625 RepID=A0A7R9LRX4_9ACAR|nr:unnamed protein product [Oppiella nova]CAG2165769.1 unnamed protein product [Oppiella nova]
MLQTFVSLTLLCCISATYYGDYEYGFNKYFNGLKKQGIGSYNSGGYLPNSYGQGYGDQGYGYGYGQGFGYGHHNPYPYKRFSIIKRLPPIYKDVKQHVYVEQPVIIRKVPVIHKKKEVTVEKQPPIYDINPKPHVVEKDVGVGGYKPMGGVDMEGKDFVPMVEYEHKMPGYMPAVDGMPGVAVDEGVKQEMEKEEEMDEHRGHRDVGVGEGKGVIEEKEVMIDMKDKKLPVPEMGGDGDEGFGDFNPKDFELQSKESKN